MDQSRKPTTNEVAIFRPFDPAGVGRVYVRNLPHWRQPGATYFVTLRQDDSIPAPVLAEWIGERDHWFRANGIDPKLRHLSPEKFDAAYKNIPVGVRRAFERSEAKMLHEELDKCHGSCVLKSPSPRKIVVDALHFFHGNRLWMGDFVVMPNHVHAILIPYDGWELEDLMGSIKKWTSRLIGKWRAEGGRFLDSESQATADVLDSESQATGNALQHSKPRFWQFESYDRIIRDHEGLWRFRQYIASNGHKAKLGRRQFTYQAANWLDEFAARPSAR